jgi:hypothetical protein
VKLATRHLIFTARFLPVVAEVREAIKEAEQNWRLQTGSRSLIGASSAPESAQGLGVQAETRRTLLPPGAMANDWWDRGGGEGKAARRDRGRLRSRHGRRCAGASRRRVLVSRLRRMVG